MKFNTLFIAAVTLLAGCSVPEGKLITEIDADLWAKICADDSIAFDSAEETITCDGTDITIPAVTATTRETGCNTAYGSTSTWTEPECAAVTFGDFKDYLDFEGDDCDATVVSTSPFVDCFAAHTAAMAN